MSNLTSTAALPQDCLQRLFAAATREASGAMARWTDGQVTLACDALRDAPLAEACEALGLGDELLTMVVLTLSPPLAGVFILAFDEDQSRQLAASLLHRPASEGDTLSPLEISALCETGNILSCAYLNALARLTDCPLAPAPPQFMQDFGSSVLQQALLAQASEGEHALVCQTTFHFAGRELDWQVLFVPSPALRDEMLRGAVNSPRE